MSPIAIACVLLLVAILDGSYTTSASSCHRLTFWYQSSSWYRPAKKRDGTAVQDLGS